MVSDPEFELLIIIEKGLTSYQAKVLVKMLLFFLLVTVSLTMTNLQMCR